MASPKGQGTLGRGLRRSELRRATPWNTYVIDGLPPTPIANPGLASLEAAVAPDETDFMFFVADGTGGHAFAETLQEHNRNVAKWREIEAERQQLGQLRKKGRVGKRGPFSKAYAAGRRRGSATFGGAGL